MNKEHTQRIEAWNELKRTFSATCQEIDELKKQIDSGNIYHSSDYDDEKKSQLVIAFIEKPINVYRKENKGLQVETQWGCRLIYELNYNGSISARIKDYDDNTYKLSTYPSASAINKLKIRDHVRKFFLIETNNNKTLQPDFWCRLKFNYFILIQQKSYSEILKIILVQIPFIKQLVKTISDEKR